MCRGSSCWIFSRCSDSANGPSSCSGPREPADSSQLTVDSADHGPAAASRHALEPCQRRGNCSSERRWGRFPYREGRMKEKKGRGRRGLFLAEGRAMLCTPEETTDHSSSSRRRWIRLLAPYRPDETQ